MAFVDIYTLKLLAHLPAILASQRRNVMVIGLGTGVTAGELTLYPDIERIDVAEISPTVVEALPYFSKATYHVENNPKVRIHIGDAFRILGRSKTKWDIIISEPSNLWVTGVDQLFTKEFYAIAKQRLSVNGILLQWVHRYEAVLASLNTIGLSSLDAILLRELWSPSYIKDFFSDFGIQTMDNPRLHYMAGKAFFMDLNISEVLLGPASIPYLSEYLLVKRHPEWAKIALDFETVRSFWESTKDRVKGHLLPMVPAVRLKAYLYDPNKFSLTAQEKKSNRVDLIPMITGKARDEESWAKVGLKGASYRTKAKAMLSHIDKHRNWIVPYPIDGLKALLEEGILQGADAYEKNWCALQMVFFLTYERADQGRIKAVFDRLQRDKYGNVLLRKEDEEEFSKSWEMGRPSL